MTAEHTFVGIHVSEKVNAAFPKAGITDLDLQFYLEVLILTFCNFKELFKHFNMLSFCIHIL
jgi:hypothetical protein